MKEKVNRIRKVATLIDNYTDTLEAIGASNMLDKSPHRTPSIDIYLPDGSKRTVVTPFILNQVCDTITNEMSDSLEELKEELKTLVSDI